MVLKGSGRASDILCYGFENSIEIESEGTGGRKERKMPGIIQEFLEWITKIQAFIEFFS